MSDTVFDLRAQVSADVSPFNKAMDSSATSVSSSLSTMRNAAKMFIGSGVVRSFMKATEAAYKFGQSLADISSISDLNIKSLSKSILQLENVYGRASTVGDTIYEIISSGIQGSESELINFAKVAGQTAVSIKANLYDTANVLTTLTNAYGMSADQVGRLGDMLFVAVREGKAHGNELAKTLGLVTNTAAEAGVSLAEMTAVISILSRTQSPSQSMIGFNQMLNGLIKPTQEAAREAEKWGIEIGATALQTRGLTAILEEMHNKIGGNVEAINKILGNIRAMRAGVSLTGRQFENFIDVLKQAQAEIGSNAFEEAFVKQTATSRQALENLKTQIDKTFIAIGQDFESSTKWVTQFTETLLKSFTDASTIGKWSIYIVAIGTAIRGAVTSLRTGSKILEHLTGATDRTTKATKSVSEHVSAVNTALPKSLEKVQEIRAAMQQVATIVADIQTRMSYVSGISIKAPIQDALKTSKDATRAQAEKNLGISVPTKKYKDTAEDYNTRKSRIEQYVLKRHGMSPADFTTPLIRQALSNLNLKAPVEKYKGMSPEDMHKYAMGKATPQTPFKFGYEPVNEFALNLDMAVLSLKNFNTSLSNISTKMRAALLPDENKRYARALYVSEERIQAQAKRNINATYIPFSKKQLRDPETGRFVSKDAVLEAEIARLRENVAQRKSDIRRDRKTQQIMNAESEKRYNEALISIQTADLKKVEANSAQRSQIASELMALRKQKKQIEAEIVNATNAEQRAYWRDLKLDNENRTALAKEMLRIRKARKAEADAIEKEFLFRKGRRSVSEEERFTTRQRRLQRLRDGYAERAADLTNKEMSDPGAFTDKDREELKKADAKALKYAQQYADYTASRTTDAYRSAQEQRKQAETLKRFNRRFKTHYTSYDKALRAVNIKKAARDLRNGFSVVSYRLYKLSLALASWQVGLSIGDSIRKSFKLDDMFVSESLRREERENELQAIEARRKSTYATIDRLVVEKKLTAAQADAITASVAMAKSMRDLSVASNRLAEETKGNAPKEKTLEEKRQDLLDKYEEDLKEIQHTAQPIGGRARILRDQIDAMSISDKDARTFSDVYGAIGASVYQKRYIKEADLLEWSARAMRGDFGSAADAVNVADDARAAWTAKALLPSASIKQDLFRAIIDKLSAVEGDEALTKPQFESLVLDAVAEAIPILSSEPSSMEDMVANEYAIDARKRLIEMLYEGDNPLMSQLKATYFDKDAQALSRKSAELALRNNLASGMFGLVSAADSTGVRTQSEQVSAVERKKGVYGESYDYAHAVASIQGSYELLDKHQADLRAMQEQIGFSIGVAKKQGLTDAEISAKSADSYSLLSMKQETMNTLRKQVSAAEEALFKAISNRVDDASKLLKVYGVQEDSSTYASSIKAVLTDELATLDKIIANTTDERIKQSYERVRSDVQTKLSQTDTQARSASELRQLKMSAGVATESQFIRQDIADEQAVIAMQKAAIAQNEESLKNETMRRRRIDTLMKEAERKRIEATLIGEHDVADAYAKRQDRLRAQRDSSTEAIHGYTAKRVQLNENLLKSSLNLRIAFNKLADSTNEAKDRLMGTVKEFTSKRDDRGRMTNDALWHSVNLSARMGRMVRSAPFMVSTMDMPNRQKAANMRQKAQSAVSASVDSWIMSQKYAEANMGKAVTDIRDYIVKQNTIMVRR